MRIQLLMLGRTRRAEVRAMIEEYVNRISKSCRIEVTEVRDAAGAQRKLDAQHSAIIVLLDTRGKTLDSEGFARWLGEHRDRGTRELIFLCGDADGFPSALRQLAHQKISLSNMTFSHELARLMLAEQIYRAFAILSGSPYPK